MNHIDAVKASYTAFATADRDLIESLLADDLVFSAPPDVGIDRATYFERCWPGAGGTERFDYVRLAEVGDEVLVTYEATRAGRHPLPQHGDLRVRGRADRLDRGLLRLGPE